MGGISGGSAIYLNVNMGKLINKDKGLSYYAYEGRLLEIKQKEDEYQGKKITKIQLKIKDKEGEVVIVSFNKETWFSHGFFSRIDRLDVSKDFILGCSQSDKNEKVSFCWIKQSDEVIKKKEGFIQPEKTPDGKYTDWTKAVEVFNNVAKGLQDKLSKLSDTGEAPVAEPEKTEGVADDLPF